MNNISGFIRTEINFSYKRVINKIRADMRTAMLIIRKLSIRTVIGKYLFHIGEVYNYIILTPVYAVVYLAVPSILTFLLFLLNPSFSRRSLLSLFKALFSYRIHLSLTEVLFSYQR